MKKFTKISLLFIAMLSIVALTACAKGGKKETEEIKEPTKIEESKDKEKTGEKETLVYELSNPGITGEITIEVENNIIKKTISETHINYAEAGADKVEMDKKINEGAKLYEGMKGADHKLELTDTEVNEVLTLDYAAMDKESKEGLFGAALNENGEVEVDKFIGQFESMGYVKK